MNEFFRTQIDYVFFFYGLGFVLLGAICLTQQRTEGGRLPWIWLGSFGLIHGVSEWIDILGLSPDRHSTTVVVSLVMKMASYLILMEFGRVGFGASKGLLRSRVILLAAVLVASLGAIHGLTAIDAASRYAICFPAAVLAAVALAREAGTMPKQTRIPLAFGAAALGMYGILAGLIVPQAEFFPANVINVEAFFRTLGFPVQFARGVLALWICTAVWVYAQRFELGEADKATRARGISGSTLLVVMLALVLMGGWIWTDSTGKLSGQDLRESLLNQCTSAAAALDFHAVSSLTGTSADTGKPAFKTIKTRLEAIHRVDTQCRFVYLTGIRRGQLVFLADAEPPNSKDYSPPGQVYTEATPAFIHSFQDGKPFSEGPVKDRWGEWVSGLVPVKDPHTHRVIAVLGIDLSGTKWRTEVLKHRLAVITITMLLCLLTATILGIVRRQELTSRRIRASENRYRIIADNLTYEEERLATTLRSIGDAVISTDTQGAVVIFNKVAEQLTGWTQEQALGLPLEEVFNIVHGITGKKCPNPVRQALKTGRPASLAGHTVLISKQGHRISIADSCAPILGRDDQVAGAVLVFRDVTQRIQAEDILKRYELLSKHARDIMLFVATDGRIIEANDAAVRAYGYHREELLSKTVFDLRGQSARSLVAEQIAQGQKDGARFEARHYRKDGTSFPVEVSLQAYTMNNERVLMSVIRDITERKRDEASLRMQTSAINAATDLIVITDINGAIEFVNPAFERETGYQYDEAIGQNPRVLKSERQADGFYENLWQTILSGQTWSGELTNRRKDGSFYVEDMTITPVKNDAGETEHFVAIKRNITDKKRREERLDHLAYHDALTDLPNRLLFGDHLTRTLADSRRRREMAAVLFFDLDHFKHVNDTLGHDVGDALLRSVAARLTWCLREVDTIARMGGDEFTIILSNVSGPQEAAEVAARVMHAISQPVTIDGHEIVVSASIGISLFPIDGENAETMVKNADAAMYRAKENGKNNYQFHGESVNVTATERMIMEEALRNALNRDELVVYYQPRVDMATGQFHGTEALVRWMHPGMGLVSPGEFIPMAEETGLIVPLSECVLRAACRQNKAWQEAGFPEMDVAVNISTRLFRSGELLEMVKGILEEVGMEAKYLNLELSENVLVEDHEITIEKLRELKSIGVRVSIDEFGTGDFSTNSLQQLPIDMLKIAPSFVKDIETNPSDATIARAMISTAHGLNLTVIAVGVETLEQHSFLRSVECDQMQGYFVSPPVPADNLTEQLRKAQDHGSGKAVRSAA